MIRFAPSGTRSSEEAAAGRIFGSSLWEGWGPFVVCCLLLGQIPPDVNESHYLTKAKQFWGEGFCPGDLFLGSADAHWLFFATTGWLTKFVSLSAYAWIGRIVCWGAFAFAWSRMVGLFLQSKWAPTGSLVIFLLLNLRFHLAGEWVVGGFEGKSIAYVMAIWALYGWFRRDPADLALGLGGSIGFHALAGLWLTFGVGVAEMVMQIGRSSREGFVHLGPLNWENRSWAWIKLASGVMAGSIGLIAAGVSQVGSSNEQLVLSAWIQVTERLSHHLWFPAMETSRQAAFALLVAFWLLLALRRNLPLPVRALHVLAAIGIGVALGGLVLSALVAEREQYSDWACVLLRLYWFRFADFAVPLACAVSSAWMTERWLVGRGRRIQWGIACVAAALLLTAIVCVAWERWTAGGSLANVAALESLEEDDFTRKRQLIKNWLKVCQWINENTEPDALFITPARQQTFKWHAGRAEVVCWKDMPQDPAAILEWSDRIHVLNRPQLESENGIFAFDDLQLRELGGRYGATYLLAMQSDYQRVEKNCRLELVYPAAPEAKVSFVVLRLR